MSKCKIILKDEVNIKFENLDLSIRKHLTSKFRYRVPGAQFIPSVRLGRWDGCINFFTLGGATYLNLLPEILPILNEYSIEVEVDDRRSVWPEFVFTKVDDQSYSHLTWPEGHRFAGENITLRDYQVNIINEYLADTQCLQEIATGAGKTLITGVLSHKIEPYGRSIVIVPTKTLVTQTEDDYKNLQLDVGVFYGKRKEFGHKHTICTWQSLDSLLKKTKKNEAPITIDEFLKDVICVIVDEAHAAKADALKALLTGPFANVPIRWGLTGTIPKEVFDYTSLMIGIGEVINKVDASTLQEAGVLANCHVQVLQTVDLLEFSNYSAELKHLVTDPKRVEWIAETVSDISKTGNTLVLVDRIEAGQLLEELIPDSVFISGTTKDKKRKEHYDEIASSEGKTIVATFGVASVGINLPRLFNVVLIEPGKSFIRTIQSIGRGLRIAEDKDFVQIYDITSTCKFSKRHLGKRKQFYRDANYKFSVKKI